MTRDNYVVFKTTKLRYAVRPASWAGIWDKNGLLKDELNHIAIFSEEQDARDYIEWRIANERGRLVKLRFNVGETIYKIWSCCYKNTSKNKKFVARFRVTKVEITEGRKIKIYYTKNGYERSFIMGEDHKEEDFYNTETEALDKIKEMELEEWQR